MVSQTISHYKVLERLGGGGMGVVYRAVDTHLDRILALKLLPLELTRDETARQRFVQEAKAASALDHQNICTIYDVDTMADGQMFMAMAFYDGESLKKRIERGPLPVGEALGIAMAVTDGLGRAHEEGIIHRDIKPANLMVTKTGVVKIVDFGIAKLLGETGLTRTGTTVGTLAYMAPEQINGEDADARTDVWAVGVVLYEMITGQPPFRGENDWAVMNAIVTQAPPPIADLPPDVERVLQRALAKDRALRYGSATELRGELARCREAMTVPVASLSTIVSKSAYRKGPIVAISGAALALVAMVAAWWSWETARIGFERSKDLADIGQLVAADDYAAAFSLAQRVESLGGDPQLATLWPQVSRALTITTEPDGATIRARDYRADNGKWMELGTTPLVSRTPRVPLRIQILKDGYEPVERIIAVTAGGGDVQATIPLSLKGVVAPRMVAIERGEFILGFVGFGDFARVPGPAFLMDRYEVTNGEFKQFVEAGGYRTPEHWKYQFLTHGRPVTWKVAMAEFRDPTGQPGPATWELGMYPAGQDMHPVSGVSWYEAAAYCASVGKTLPTIYHWSRAAGMNAGQVSQVFGQFESTGTVPVGTKRAMSPFGLEDMAGNVKEWVSTSTGDGSRYILGGAWSDRADLFNFVESRPPFDRSHQNGFRCARYDDKEPGPDDLFRDVVRRVVRDYSKESPASDERFAAYRTQFAYDHAPLDARTESVDDKPLNWTVDKVTFDAGYGGERVIAYLYLPKSRKPPYKTVVVYPGLNVVFTPSSANLRVDPFSFLMVSGRAVVYPIYDGTYERNRNGGLGPPLHTNAGKERRIRQMKDLQRSIDYVETRPEFDDTDLAYLGISAGAAVAPLALAIEDRLKAGVLAMGGLAMIEYLPEVDPINFVRHVTQPVLMLNGSLDHLFPVQESQKPLYKLLGTPAGQKDHRVYPDMGHDLMARLRNQMIREILEWLDRYQPLQ